MSDVAGGVPSVRVHCSIHARPASILFTGFGELAHQGRLRLEWVKVSATSADPYRLPQHLRVEINDDLQVLYDVGDAFTLDDSLDFSRVALVIKRSYRPDFLARHPYGERVLPLGLCYYVRSAYDHGLRRALWAKNDRDKLKQIVRSSALLSRLLRVRDTVVDSSIESFETPPAFDQEPRVVFAARLWKPYRVPEGPLRQEREQMNATRVHLVRALRREFGVRFVGGLEAEPYAASVAPDCLLDASAVWKGSYLDVMHQSPICVATRGLLEAYGFKFAEYVAAGRAIVSEHNDNLVPGFEAERDYLSFDTVDQCVAQVARLMDDPPLRRLLMERTRRYYRAYLRPDTLVMNSINAALAWRDQTSLAAD